MLIYSYDLYRLMKEQMEEMEANFRKEIQDTKDGSFKDAS